MNSVQRPVPPIPVESDEVAWVTIQTPLGTEQLTELSRDVEAMFRINPCYRFSSWREMSQDVFHVTFQNESNQQEYDLQLRLGDITRGSYSVYYSHGLKKRTIFAIRAAETGSSLVVLDEYQTPPEDQNASGLKDVDKSLQTWGASLHKYFLRQQRYRNVPGWRWYMRLLWIPMQPSARRVVWFIWLISVLEFSVFMVALLIYVIERNH